MSRKRRVAAENDSLDLLLDTVSNVFGGVMFLTLLAALMILSRGASGIAPEPASVTATRADDETAGPPLDDRIVQMELEQLASAIEAQRSVLENLQSTDEDVGKLETIRSLRSAVTRQQRLTDQMKSQAEQDEEQSDALESRLEDLQRDQQSLAEELRQKRERLSDAERAGNRNITFRPMSMTASAETVLILRYGRVYVFRNSPSDRSYNSEDFFRLGTQIGKQRLTPKPHRGVPVTAESMERLVATLRRNYPPHAFHVTIAVWDDSFGQFNPLCDALQTAGYRYRTIPCDDEAELSFGNASDAWVQ